MSILSLSIGALRAPWIDTADLKHRMQYGLFRGALAMFRVVPLDWPVALCARVWRVIGPRSGRHRRVLANLALAYADMTTAEREATALAMWENLGRVVAETMLLDRILKEPGRIEIVNRGALEAAMQKPGPKIGVTLHMGNWELAAWACALCGGNPAGVYRPLTNPYVDRTLLKQREHLYSGGLFTNGDSHHAGPDGQRTARLITAYVRQGGNLAFVLDQVDRRGIAIPFFGREAKFTPVPSMIARHVGARVWMARCLRVGKGTKFRVELKELEMERTENRKDDVQAITAEIFGQFETWIREAPEQWMWWNTRWEPKADANRAFQQPRRPDPQSHFRAARPRGRTKVRALTNRAGVSQPMVSKHLGTLKQAGLVRCRRDGRETHYSGRPQALMPVIDWLNLYAAFWRDRFDRLEDLLKRKDQ